MQCVRARATISVGEVISVSATGGIVSAVPRIAVASGNGITVVSTMIECKIERHRAVATCHISCSECRGACSGIIGRPVPNKTVAGGDGFCGSVAVVDCEMKRVDTRTIVRIGVNIRVYTCSGISCTVPCIAVTGRNSITIVRAIVQIEIQSVHACATRAKLAMVVCVGTRGMVCGTIPVIIVAGRNMVCVIVLSADG